MSREIKNWYASQVDSFNLYAKTKFRIVEWWVGSESQILLKSVLSKPPQIIFDESSKQSIRLKINESKEENWHQSQLSKCTSW